MAAILSLVFPVYRNRRIKKAHVPRKRDEGSASLIQPPIPAYPTIRAPVTAGDRLCLLGKCPPEGTQPVRLAAREGYGKRLAHRLSTCRRLSEAPCAPAYLLHSLFKTQPRERARPHFFGKYFITAPRQSQGQTGPLAAFSMEKSRACCKTSKRGV